LYLRHIVTTTIVTMLNILSFIRFLYYILNSFFTLVLLYYIALIFLPSLQTDSKQFIQYIYYNILLQRDVDINNDNKDNNNVINEVEEITGDLYTCIILSSFNTTIN
jgi:hypothetical protein